jgi:hypothetical protein
MNIPRYTTTRLQPDIDALRQLWQKSNWIHRIITVFTVGWINLLFIPLSLFMFTRALDVFYYPFNATATYITIYGCSLRLVSENHYNLYILYGISSFVCLLVSIGYLFIGLATLRIFIYYASNKLRETFVLYFIFYIFWFLLFILLPSFLTAQSASQVFQILLQNFSFSCNFLN